ncbi:putative hemolysin [Volucribacter psittacicida]|uniref:Putative hemolysin n=1 Tax=Volucribacter psittacicida TaxID=203482 RepID=A0A4R1FVH7_9PAST|nr:DUF333 domain-containing protein [Volucribacter psittacicida]TCJ98903.1 putative hemolysin [Volucribacter psittacicida]
MKKCLTISSILTLSACSQFTPNATPPALGMANPASVYCEQQGGKSENRRDAAGNEYGVCLLPNGEQVDEWDFYRQQLAIDKQANSERSKVLILYYDVTQRDKVLEAVAKYGASVVYDYQNFSGLAIQTAQPEATKAALEKVKGVLAVQFNQVQQLQ